MRRRKDIRKNAVNGAKVRDNGLTGADIKDSSIGPADLAPGTALGISGVLHVPAAAFVPASDTTPYALVGVLRGNALNATHDFYAPVQLPDGAVITQLEGFFGDESSTGNLGLFLKKLNPATGDDSGMAAVSTSGLAPSPTIQTVSDTTINESLRTYFFKCICSEKILRR